MGCFQLLGIVIVLCVLCFFFGLPGWLFWTGLTFFAVCYVLAQFA
jgi:hypothetical protein